MGQNGDLSTRTHNYNSAFLSTAKSATFGSHYQLASVKHNQQPKGEYLSNVPKSFSTNFTGKSSYQSDQNCSMFEKSHVSENDKASNQFSDYASTIKFKTECNGKDNQFFDKAAFLERLQKQCNEINIQMAEIVNPINELRLGFSKMNEQSIERDYLISQLQSTVIEIGNTINELQAQCNEKDKQLVDKTLLIDQLQVVCVEKDEQLIKNKDAINELQIKSNDKDKELIGKDALIYQLQASCVEDRNTIEKLQAKCNYNDKQLASKRALVEQVRKDLNKRDKQLDEIQKTINELQMVCKSKKLTEKKTLINQLQTIHDKDEKQISLKNLL